KPLAVSSLLGMLFCVFAFLAMALIIARYLIYGDPVAGWASTVVIVLFVGGVQLLCVGILGQYNAKTYLESKNRPIYIAKEVKK
ncbi:MAG: glycosyltransferase, partial [Defluviitaleaceae bacterium]|nr:glycosyltransferase [Defluviitaleaceae bacterium]